jgi:hypothetical protein
MWTRTGRDGKTRGRALKSGEEQRVRAELENYYRFVELGDQIVGVNEAICETRQPGASAPQPLPATSPVPPDGEKGGSARRSRRSSPPRSSG